MYYGNDVEGGGVERIAKALNLYEKAAGQGCVGAQCDLGECYYSGTHVKMNPVKAVYWFRRAAEQKCIEAYYRLGMCYEYAKVLEKSFSTTVI